MITTRKQSAANRAISRAKPGPASGFSVVELVIVTAVIFILLGVGLPFFARAYRDYQLDDAGTQAAGILKATRLEAIRRNVPVNCVIQRAGNLTNIWADANGDGIEQGTEPQILLRGPITLAEGGTVPGTGALAAAVGVATLTAVSPIAATLNFDFRGAVNPAGVYAIYINDLAPNGGYRAVILLPSGSVQTWGASAAGVWRQIS